MGATQVLPYVPKIVTNRDSIVSYSPVPRFCCYFYLNLWSFTHGWIS